MKKGHENNYTSPSTTSLHTTSVAILFLSISMLFAKNAIGMDWEFRTSSLLSAEGGWISGSKVPLNSKSQTEYDNETSKSGSPSTAEEKIKILQLQGLETVNSASTKIGYEGFSHDLHWQATVDALGSIVVGNSTGSFYNSPGELIFPTQGRIGRNSGWIAGAAGTLHWLPINSFTMRIQSSFTNGADSFKESFSRVQVSPEFELKAARFVLTPNFNWQRILALDALPAADIRAWSLDVEWIGNRFFRFQNPNGFPLIRTWKVSALGSALLVRALENEGSFLEINLTPRISLSGTLVLASHFRSLSGSNMSYIAPSLAEAIQSRGKKLGDWSPPRPSADYSNHSIEWKNSLIKRVLRNLNVSLSILYTNRSSVFTPSALSNFEYSSLIDNARESSFRYFLGSEFLL